MDSLRAQAIPEWVRFNPVLDGTPNPIDLAKTYESLAKYIRSKLSSFDRNDPVLKNLQEGYRHEADWPPFFQKIVEDRADALKWDALNDDQRAIWFAHQLFRKLPSPGRVYRFWREAEAFFRDLLREFRQIAARSEIPGERAVFLSSLRMRRGRNGMICKSITASFAVSRSASSMCKVSGGLSPSRTSHES
ncbi:MAG: hypothetical protein KatS3mg111_3547 [Pirellulaceae bacterium]|nr:MAG: hypothetical protein KatS3mg111_3547 [Pirellulaceae bacterium]